MRIQESTCARNHDACARRLDLAHACRVLETLKKKVFYINAEF